MRLLQVFLLCILILVVAGCTAEELSTEPGSGARQQPASGARSEEFVLPATAITRTPAPVTGIVESAPDLNPQSTRPAVVAGAVNSGRADSFNPEDWQELPVLPELSPRALEILEDGLARGNNPRAFSKIGDCESQASWFLEPFDLGPEHYALGEYERELAPVIAYYAGSHKRVSLAAKPGFSAASLLSPIWADREQCEDGETPLACEYRINNPLVSFVMVGTNDASNPKTFEGHMRRVLDETIALGILPVLGTKADNVEGDHFINETIARLAHEYGLPVWNYWAAVQPLPARGLQEDGVHLTFAAPYFDRPGVFERAWPVRNLNALQVLKILQQATEEAGG